MILEGLSADYAPVVFVIESKFDIMNLDEVKILLVARELRLAKFKKNPVPNLVSLNLNHIMPPTSPSASSQKAT